MRSRLALLVAATTTLVLLAFLIPLGLLLGNVAADRAIGAATREAETVVPLVATLDRATLKNTLDLIREDDTRKVPLTVFLADGAVLGVPAERTDAVELASRGRSITVDAQGGREVLIAAVGLPGGTAVIRTFVSDQDLRAGVTRAWLILGGLGACLLALSLLVADRLGASAVRSVQHLDDVARQLGEGDLDARAKPAPIRELNEVGTTLNALAERIRDLLARERESVADLSHRVRTPLTVLRIDAEALSDQAEAERLTRDVIALERAVDQVIIDARRGTKDGEQSDATEVVRERVEFWRALADEEGRTVTSDLPEAPTPVAVGADDLAACLDALLGNVFTHTPEGTALAVELRLRPAGGALLRVSDEGPGFRDEAEALSRGASDAGSTGLGLDIVRRTAESSGGGMALGNGDQGGARITVELGPPAGATGGR